MALYIDNKEILTLDLNGTKIETVTINGTTVARKPTITDQPDSQTITDAQTATLSVAADGLGSTLGYQWRKGDGTAVSGANSASYVFTPTSTGTFQFYCDVSGFGGVTKTNTVTVTVEASVVAPVITTDPVGGTITEGENYTASIVVNWGGETGTIVWYLDDVAQSSSNSTSFTFNNVEKGTHKIKAKATNSKGSDTSSEATLTATPAQATITIGEAPPFEDTVTRGYVPNMADIDPDLPEGGFGSLTYPENIVKPSGSMTMCYASNHDLLGNPNPSLFITCTTKEGEGAYVQLLVNIGSASAILRMDDSIFDVEWNEEIKAWVYTFSVLTGGNSEAAIIWHEIYDNNGSTLPIDITLS